MQSEQQPFIITISRQLGAGGSFLGQQVSASLGFPYADREIVNLAAQTFHVSEELGESMDEKMTPLWQSLLQVFECGSPVSTYCPPPIPSPSDSAFHEAESEVIRSIARNGSAVIVGRGGFYVLRDYPLHLRVFLHADMHFRLRRVCEVYGMPARTAEEVIKRNDREREHYIRHLTGADWTDATQYDLCLDTSTMELQWCEQIIVDSVLARGWGVEKRC